MQPEVMAALAAAGVAVVASLIRGALVGDAPAGARSCRPHPDRALGGEGQGPGEGKPKEKCPEVMEKEKHPGGEGELNYICSSGYS